MLVAQIGLVSRTRNLGLPELSRGSAAVQKQVTRDFGPIWGIQATVNAFNSLKEVPLGYWSVVVMDNINTPGAAGVHLDRNGQPYALVSYSSDWVLTASHETLEMLADPFGNRLIAGQSPKPGQGRVEFLVEVCDPSEAAEFGYTVNGLVVSDFYTPNYFDPVTSAGVRYSFTGAIKKPRQVLKGGYLSWHDPIGDHWWQERFFSGTKPSYADLGVFSNARSLREQVDAGTPSPMVLNPAQPKAVKEKLFAAAGATSTAEADEACAARGKALETDMDALLRRVLKK